MPVTLTQLMPRANGHQQPWQLIKLDQQQRNHWTSKSSMFSPRTSEMREVPEVYPAEHSLRMTRTQFRVSNSDRREMKLQPLRYHDC